MFIILLFLLLTRVIHSHTPTVHSTQSAQRNVVSHSIDIPPESPDIPRTSQPRASSVGPHSTLGTRKSSASRPAVTTRRSSGAFEQPRSWRVKTTHTRADQLYSSPPPSHPTPQDYKLPTFTSEAVLRARRIYLYDEWSPYLPPALLRDLENDVSSLSVYSNTFNFIKRHGMPLQYISIHPDYLKYLQTSLTTIDGSPVSKGLKTVILGGFSRRHEQKIYRGIQDAFKLISLTLSKLKPDSPGYKVMKGVMGLHHFSVVSTAKSRRMATQMKIFPYAATVFITLPLFFSLISRKSLALKYAEILLKISLGQQSTLNDAEGGDTNKYMKAIRKLLNSHKRVHKRPKEMIVLSRRNVDV